jgi:phosphoserine phosphatase RsbU/P
MDRAASTAASPAIAPVPWRRSLRTRLLLWSSLTNVIVLAGVTLAFYAGARAVMIANAKAETRSLATQTARGLQATLDSVQVSGRTLAVSASGVGREPFNLRSLLQATIAGDPDISGAMLIIEPGAFKDKEPGFSWYLRRDKSGIKEQSVESLGYDYHAMPWYQRTQRATQPFWSEPYENAATNHEWFTTYTLPLRRAGDRPDVPAIGMVSVDVPVVRLRTVVQALPDDSGLRPVLLSPGGLLVMHPDPAVQMKMTLPQFIARFQRTDLAPLAAPAGTTTPVEFDHVVPGTGEKRYTIASPVADTGWRFALSASEEYILGGLARATFWAAAIGLLGILLSQVVIRRFSGLIARPIEDLTDSAQQFARGNFDYPLLHTGRSDEVGVMARAFDSARGSIKQQLDEIEDFGAARQKLDSELSIARDIQLAMLPPGRVFDGSDTHLDTFAILEPATAVGGDFYTFFERDVDKLWFIVGDVSDKGIPAALFMARSVTVLEVAARRGGSPAAVLLDAARRLIEGNETCMFATVVCGLIEEETGECLIASAGHEPPVLLREDGHADFVPVIAGPPLGFEVADQYAVWRGRLRTGDTLLVYTDGISEAFDAQDTAFGSERLLAGLDPALGAEAQCAALLRRVHAFTGDAAQSDDITVLAVKFLRGEEWEGG